MDSFPVLWELQKMYYTLYTINLEFSYNLSSSFLIVYYWGFKYYRTRYLRNIHHLIYLTFAVEVAAGTNQVDDSKYPCRFGCCGYDGFHGCRCCSYAGESQGLDTEATTKEG